MFWKLTPIVWSDSLVIAHLKTIENRRYVHLWHENIKKRGEGMNLLTLSPPPLLSCHPDQGRCWNREHGLVQATFTLSVASIHPCFLYILFLFLCLHALSDIQQLTARHRVRYTRGGATVLFTIYIAHDKLCHFRNVQMWHFHIYTWGFGCHRISQIQQCWNN